MSFTPTIWSGPTTVSTLSSAAQSSITALAEGGYVVAFQRIISGASDLAGLRYTETGAVVNVNLLAAVSVESRALGRPEIAQLADGRLATAYTLTFGPGDNDLFVTSNAAGSYASQPPVTIDTSLNHDFILDIEATADGGYLVMWQRSDTGNVRYQGFSGAGTAAFGVQTLSAPPQTSATTAGDIAVLSGGFIATIVANGSNGMVEVRSRNGSDYVSPFSIGNADLVAIEALAGDRFAVASGSGGYGVDSIYTKDGVLLNRNQENYGADGTFLDVNIAGLADGGYLVGRTLQLSSSPLDSQIRVQRYNDTGTLTDAPLIIDAPGMQTLEDMQTLSDGRVVVSYRSANSASDATTTLKTITIDPREATLFGTVKADVFVGRLNDTSYSGGDGNDRATGMGGDDILFGQSGDDTLTGGLGDDTLDGGSGTDVLSGGDGDDVLKGGSGVDSLTGGAGADTLYGGSSGDILIGSGGRDTLWGGSGGDLFRQAFASDSGATTATQDVIRDFAQGEDRIDLALIDANLDVAGNEAFVFIGGAAFTAAGQVRFTSFGGFTRVELNTTGTSTLESGILVEGIIAFTSSDFIL